MVATPRGRPSAGESSSTRSFQVDALTTDTLAAARALVGARLVRGRGPEARVGRIIEVEAYVGQEDLACHARYGRTDRNATMFGPPGRAYVYFVYGMYHCLNVVTEPEGCPSAVLIRAVEPIAGIERMRLARAEHAARRRAERDVGATANSGVGRVLPEDRLASGPGLVCAAFSITRRDDGVDLCDPASDLRLETAPSSEEAPVVSAGPRVGIGYAPEPWLSNAWRFFVADSASLSTGRSRGSRSGGVR